MAREANKADLVFIAKHRHLGHTEAALWKLPTPKLRELIDKLTEAEQALIRTQRILRGERGDKKTTLAALQKQASTRGVPFSGRSRDGLLDLLLDEPPSAPAFMPDPDQASLLERWNDPLLVVAAGPGSGKTSTLVALVARILRERPGSRILVLAYNRNAEHILKERFSAQGVRPVRNDRALSREPGLRLMTFDKYGYWRSRNQEGSASAGLSLDDLFPDEAPSPAPAKQPSTQPEVATQKGPANPLSEAKDGYRQALERASRLAAGPGEDWDWVVVDEAQDVLAAHAAIIEHLRGAAAHLVVAGDPRQEIYSGAVWFGRLWAELKGSGHVLRHNHRSAPAVVSYLNRYSRQHFPTLHHDQLPARADGCAGSVRFSLASGDEPKWGSPAARLIRAGKLCADLIAQREPGDAYAIAPVTLRKYHHGPAVDALRQALHEAHPEVFVRVLGDGSEGVLDGSAYCIGTSFKLKGTERRRVAAFGICSPYVQYGLDPVLLKKLVYVALSRARDELCIVFDSLPPPDSPLAGLVPPTIPSGEQKNRKERRQDMAIDISNDLALLDCWDAKGIPAASFEPLRISQRDDSDFVGLYVEASLAHAAGVPLHVSSITSTAEQLGAGVFPFQDAKTGAWSREVVYDKKAMPHGLEEIERICRETATHPAYGYAVLCRTVSISRRWTVSERLASENLDTEALQAPLSRLLEQLEAPERLDPADYGGRLLHQVSIDRSEQKAGLIVGQTDFARRAVGGWRVVEVKHARDSGTHRAQAALYATLAGAETAMVLNTLEGTATIVPAFSIVEVDGVARATLAFKRAAQVANRLSLRLADATKTAVVIAVDVETDGGSLLTEIGAVAFERGSGRVVGAFRRLGAGLAEARPGLFDTGLAVSDRAALVADQESMKLDMVAWADMVAPARSFLHWGGSDLEKLGLTDQHAEASQNVYTLYQAWLDATKQKRSGDLALKSAVAHVLGPSEPFEPHRAFEDAVMTAAVFMAIVSASGAV